MAAHAGVGQIVPRQRLARAVELLLKGGPLLRQAALQRASAQAQPLRRVLDRAQAGWQHLRERAAHTGV